MFLETRTERLLVVAPIGRDGALIEAMLTKSGVEATAVRSLAEVIPMVVGGRAGALLVTEEALSGPSADALLALLEAQPTWSDLPILLLSSDHALTREVRNASTMLEARANVTLIERPVRSRTLARAAHGALRARRRQYDMREMLDRERETRHEVEAASRAKDEFLATVSHELRTPLNAILGWAQLVRGGALGEEQNARAIETIERNAVAQARLIEDLLDVSRVVSGNLRLTLGRVDLERVVQAACDMLKPMADTRRVKLVTDIDASATGLVGDAARLQQIVWNLVSNAVKFSAPGSRVEVRVAADGPGTAVVSVTDHGEGIDPAFLPHVFERFRQADGSSTRAHGGLGLGLAIVRSLTELHGGTVTATSEGRGRGASFAVRLPRSTESVEMPKRAAISSQPTSASLRGMRVLVVDDDPDAREIASAVLTNFEAEVVAVGSVGEALDRLPAARPDVLVCDIGMPERDGYSLIESVRSLPHAEGGDVPAVALTAYTRPADRSRALAAGFDEHLGKPLDVAKLVRVVASLGGRRVVHA